MEFEKILKLVKEGSDAYNSVWNGLKDTSKIIYISLQKPDENSLMTQPYLVIHTGTFVEGSEGGEDSGWKFKRCPWIPSQSDLMADTWEIREPVEISEDNK